MLVHTCHHYLFLSENSRQKKNAYKVAVDKFAVDIENVGKRDATSKSSLEENCFNEMIKKLGKYHCCMIAAKCSALYSKADNVRAVNELKFLRLCQDFVKDNDMSETYLERFIRSNLDDNKSIEYLTMSDLFNSRQKKVTICNGLLNISDDNMKEIYLLREFVIGCLSPFHQLLVRNLLVGNFDNGLYLLNFSFDFRKFNILWIFPVLSISYYAVAGLIVVLWGTEVFSMAPKLFIIIFLSSYFGDIFLVVPTKNLLQYLVIDALTYRELDLLKRFIVMRARPILMRRTGFFKFRYWAIQHTNPAVRSAREFPKLSVSKLLLCINDFDVPKGTKKRTILNKMRRMLDVCCLFVSAPFTSVSSTFGVIIFEVIVAVSLGALTYLCDDFNILPIAPAVFSLPSVLLLCSLASDYLHRYSFNDTYEDDMDEDFVDLLNLEKKKPAAYDQNVIDNISLQGSATSTTQQLILSSPSRNPERENNQTPSPNRKFALPPIDLSSLYQGTAKKKPVFTEGGNRKSRDRGSERRRKPHRERLLDFSDRESNEINEDQNIVSLTENELATALSNSRDLLPPNETNNSIGRVVLSNSEEEKAVDADDEYDQNPTLNNFREVRGRNRRERTHDDRGDNERSGRRRHRRHGSRHRSNRHRHDSADHGQRRRERRNGRYRSRENRHDDLRRHRNENRHENDNDPQERVFLRPRNVVDNIQDVTLQEQYMKDSVLMVEDFQGAHVNFSGGDSVHNDRSRSPNLDDDESLQLSWTSLGHGSIVALDAND
jgi:hypothetical protein